MENELFTTGSIGRKIERIRKIRGIKQETLANSLGLSRQAVGKLEQLEDIDDEKLSKIALALGVTVEMIKNFNEDAMFNNYIHANGTVYNHVSNIQQQQSEKYNELLEELLKSNKEKTELYEALLKSEREKNEILQKLVDKK